MDNYKMSLPPDPSHRNSIRLSEEQKMEILNSLKGNGEVMNDGKVKLPKDKKVSVTLSPDGTHAQVCYGDVCRIAPIVQKQQEQDQPQPTPKKRTFSRSKSHPEEDEEGTQSIHTSSTGTKENKVDLEKLSQHALAALEKIMPEKSPALKRISLKHQTSASPEHKKKSSSTLERLYKKKSVPPSLVFSFSEEKEDEAVGKKESTTDPSIIANNEDKFEDYRPLSLWEKDEQSEVSSPHYNRFESQMSQNTEFTLGIPKDNFDTASMRSGISRVTMQSIEELEEIKVAKKQRFWDFFTMVSSMTYGVFLIIFGISIYFMDIFVSNGNTLHLAEWFNLYLSVVGAVSIIFLLLDIQHYITSFKKYKDMGSFTLNALKLVEGDDGELHVEIPLPEAGGNLPEYYCFSTGRHSGSFFLKIGACIFCFGHMIHMFLNIAKQASFIGKVVPLDNSSVCDLELVGGLSENQTFLGSNCAECTSPIILAFEIAYPIFSAAQLYMIFKFGNVIVNRRKHFARFAFMHCIGACLCFWLYTIIDETLAALVSKYFHAKLDCSSSPSGFGSDVFDLGLGLVSSIDVTQVYGQGGFVGASYKKPTCYPDDKNHFNFDNAPSCVIVRRDKCNGEEDSLASNISDIAQPLLFPFSIEFSILVVAVWYIMWSNIGKVEENLHSMELLPSVSHQGSQEDLHRTSGHKDAMIMYADCTSSNRGLFSGFLFCAASLCIVIIYFFMQSSCELFSMAEDIIDYTEWFIYIVMIIISIVAYVNIVKLEVNPHPISFLDDLLLFICIPCYALYALICLIPVFFMEAENPDLSRIVMTNVLTIIQVLIQTPLIIDGLRRCSDSKENQQKMPGRNTIMLLIVVNLTVYAFEIFTLMSPPHQDEMKKFYGITPWTILMHIAMPLCIFYRFHSSAALVDIWNSAYKPHEHH